MKCFLRILTFVLFAATTVNAQDGLHTGFKPAAKEDLEKVKIYDKTFKGEIKSSVDLSNGFPPPGDQGSQNSCVAWASAYAVMSYYYNKDAGRFYYQTDSALNYDAVFSPAFLYNLLNNCTNYPTTYLEAFEVLYRIGAVSWTDMPYDMSDYCTVPERRLIEKARDYRIRDVYRVKYYQTDAFREVLSNDIPILIGVYVDNNFVSEGWYTTAKYYTWSEYRGSFKAGHALVIVGYDDNIRAFKVMNSFGSKWGNNGFVWIPYSFMSECIIEAYVIEP